jgi:hypothetical protein
MRGQVNTRSYCYTYSCLNQIKEDEINAKCSMRVEHVKCIQNTGL